MSKNPNKQVLDYMVQQNRPYSAIDIFNNLHKEIGKTVVLKALDHLVSEGKIREKMYGKQKIYFVDQKEFSEFENVDLKKMDSDIIQLTNTLNELQQQLKAAESSLNGLNKSMTTETAELKLNEAKKEIPQLMSKLQSLESNTSRIGPEEKETLMKNKVKCSKELQKRKRLASDMLDAILEGYPKGKKQLYEEIGIEVD
ncbi:homologous-pairing protein 2 homolog [Parasteatoda tepidariorum]|uniref:homologous-pairing protein 2 homolog n=1 Tax=Parasteatoda tepidariorum TaxID=114398 RepID=UPI001C720230|nr:homologous-pairing protein 2 homolog [Parasteatoda tepidariorum]